MRNQSVLPLATLLASLALSGCVIHVDGSDGWNSGATSVFGDLSIGEGKTVEDVNSVNGDIFLEDRVTADTVDTVNGDIKTGKNVSVGAIDTVNGDIQGGESLTVRNNVNTVNGDIRFAKDSILEGSLETVNGDIVFTGTTVKENISSLNGDIILRSGSKVEGDIIFERRKSKSYNSEPKLIIDDSSTVMGSIILYRDVELKIDNDSLMEKVVYRGRE